MAIDRLTAGRRMSAGWTASRVSMGERRRWMEANAIVAAASMGLSDPHPIRRRARGPSAVWIPPMSSIQSKPAAFTARRAAGDRSHAGGTKHVLASGNPAASRSHVLGTAGARRPRPPRGTARPARGQSRNPRTRSPG